MDQTTKTAVGVNKPTRVNTPGGRLYTHHTFFAVNFRLDRGGKYVLFIGGERLKKETSEGASLCGWCE